MISAPCARGAGTRQAITALPSRKIVHAPHSPSAQPSLVPIKFPSSRKSRSRVLSCPFLKEYFLPLIIVSMGLDGDACDDWRLLSEISLLHNRTASDGIPACSSLLSIDLNPRRVHTRTISRRYDAELRTSSMGLLAFIVKGAASSIISAVNFLPSRYFSASLAWMMIGATDPSAIAADRTVSTSIFRTIATSTKEMALARRNANLMNVPRCLDVSAGN